MTYFVFGWDKDKAHWVYLVNTRSKGAAETTVNSWSNAYNGFLVIRGDEVPVLEEPPVQDYILLMKKA